MIKQLENSTPVIDFKNMELSIYLAKQDEYVCIYNDGSFGTIKKNNITLQKLRVDKTLIEIFEGGSIKEVAAAIVNEDASRERSKWRLPTGELLNDEDVIIKQMNKYGADKCFIREICALLGIKKVRQVN